MIEHRIWKKEYIEFLKNHCRGMSNKELTKLLNKEFSTNFNWWQVANIKCQYGLRR